MEKQKKCVATVLDSFEQVITKPDSFLNAEDSLCHKIKCNLKETYDYSKSEEKSIKKSSALPELIIKNFDVEQIWQQIELQNESILSHSITSISKLVIGKNQLIFDNLKKELESNESNENRFEDIEENDDDELVDGEKINENSDSGSDKDDFELNDNNDEVSEEETVSTKLSNTQKRKSVVDDDFFKLDEMEKFLNVEEKKIQNENIKESDTKDSDSESENSIDLFKENSDDEDEEEKTKTAKFKDFFVPKDNDKKMKRNKFLETMSDDELSNDSNQVKSSLELRQERLKRKIEELEQNAISEKSWQLKGEIRADDRPQNSLLEQIVEFDLTSRPAPIITEQTTLQLEDIIKQRIKDRAFDSVERKIKPVETPLEYRKKLVLDQEKSKHSLAQIYEKEFLDQQAALDPENADKEEEEPELHKEIKTLMRNLFNKLDALSNFHFTPKPSIPELKIVNNLPAITMEEVAQVAASDAALLAPEEVNNKAKGETMAKGERTATDKKRERRKKKLKQRAHLKEKQKRENAINKLNPGLGNKYSKEKATKMLKKVMKESNTEKMDEHVGSKAVKSSKAFFTQLQEEVQSQIHGKIQSKKSKKKKDQLVAKKIKL